MGMCVRCVEGEDVGGCLLEKGEGNGIGSMGF